MTGIDGVDHINVYSKGKTAIGRWLSNFTFAPFEHPRHGKFFSVEGFWYWRLAESSQDRERLRCLSGWAAKRAGRELVRIEDVDSIEFKGDIVAALVAKLHTYPARKADFLATTLPLAHYYEYPSGRIQGAAMWVIEEWERIRREYR